MKKYIKPESTVIEAETSCNLLAGSLGYGNGEGTSGWHAPQKKFEDDELDEDLNEVAEQDWMFKQ